MFARGYAGEAPLEWQAAFDLVLGVPMQHRELVTRTARAPMPPAGPLNDVGVVQLVQTINPSTAPTKNAAAPKITTLQVQKTRASNWS